MFAGLSVMLWPLFIAYGATLYSESTALPFFVVFLLAVPGVLGSSDARAGRWFSAGALLGLCMHIRPMYLLYSPFAAGIAYQRSPGGRRGMISVAALTGGCLAVVLPWAIGLSLHEGSPILLSASGGETLGGGINPELLRIESEGRSAFVTPSERMTWVGPGKWLPMDQTGLLSAEEKKLPFAARSNRVGRKSIAWMREHPREAAYLQVRKLAYMWGIYPFWNGWKQTILGNIPILILLPVGVIALIAHPTEVRALSLFWSLPLFVSAVALISWGSWRFRMPGDLGLIALAASLTDREEVGKFLRSVANGRGAESAVQHGDRL